MFHLDREICVRGSGRNILKSVTAGQCSLTPLFLFIPFSLSSPPLIVLFFSYLFSFPHLVLSPSLSPVRQDFMVAEAAVVGVQYQVGDTLECFRDSWLMCMCPRLPVYSRIPFCFRMNARTFSPEPTEWL